MSDVDEFARAASAPDEQELIGVEAPEDAVGLPSDWRAVLSDQLPEPYWPKLMAFVDAARSDPDHTVYPPAHQTFAAFALSDFEDTRVVILGQDPYHGPGQAHGLCFSVPDDTPRKPPSLRNICTELKNDVGVELPSGNLSGWARQGVLLLNATLTVRAGEAGSHRRQGWESFTNAVISALDKKEHRVVFVLWGKDAQKKAKLISNPNHEVIQSAHPSPFSARLGFFNSKPFSKANRLLAEAEQPQIDWSSTSRSAE